MPDALQRLIEAVELPCVSLKGSYMLDALPMNARTACWKAHAGSLDAAKALHEALLGDGYIGNGYLYCIWGSGKASVWEIISGASVHADIPQKEHHAASPARAWLLAILRAYQQLQAPAAPLQPTPQPRNDHAGYAEPYETINAPHGAENGASND